MLSAHPSRVRHHGTAQLWPCPEQQDYPNTKSYSDPKGLYMLTSVCSQAKETPFSPALSLCLELCIRKI